jgi:hypothetical protein
MGDSCGDRRRAEDDRENEDAESEWLAAGKRGDVQHLRELHLHHPERLALGRVSECITHGDVIASPFSSKVSFWSTWTLIDPNAETRRDVERQSSAK